MNREDIIRMAQEAGWKDLRNYDSEMNEFFVMGDFKSLERFAILIVFAEREACAKVCEKNANDLSEGDWDSACINCAKHIRARG